jgi:hypothetical protein
MMAMKVLHGSCNRMSDPYHTVSRLPARSMLFNTTRIHSPFLWSKCARWVVGANLFPVRPKRIGKSPMNCWARVYTVFCSHSTSINNSRNRWPRVDNPRGLIFMDQYMASAEKQLLGTDTTRAHYVREALNRNYAVCQRMMLKKRSWRQEPTVLCPNRSPPRRKP